MIDDTGKQVGRWANQTDSGQNRETPGPDRWKVRAKTYEGIADAMAVQYTDAIANGWMRQKLLF